MKLFVSLLLVVVLLFGPALGNQRCPKKKGTSKISGDYFYQYEATVRLTSGGQYPSYEPLSKVFNQAVTQCRKTCESTNRCAAWFLNSSGSSGGGSVYCSLYEKNEYTVKTGSDVCVGRQYCRTGMCK